MNLKRIKLNKKSQKFEKYNSIEELLEQINKERTIWSDIYYFLWRVWDKIKRTPKQIKWFIQRGKRGWADCDVWGLNSYLAEVISGSVKKLKKIHNGYPDGFEEEEYEEVLENISNSFKEFLQVQESLGPVSDELRNRMKDLITYFDYFWD